MQKGTLIQLIVLIVTLTAIITGLFAVAPPKLLQINNYVLLGICLYTSFSFLWLISPFVKWKYLSSSVLLISSTLLCLIGFLLILLQIGLLVWAFLTENPLFWRYFYCFLGMTLLSLPIFILFIIYLKKNFKIIQ
ncbi:MAG: hypothetical protein Q4B43_06235 [Bacteroidota bacterium]|nr:hypothetical protein [Bacteroidota bacterium]